MRDRRFEMNWYQVGDSAAMAAHLEKMAAKGWFLEKMGTWGWTYRRGEPRAVRYAVTYFPAASVFDGVPGSAQATYIDYCAAAGWELAATQAQFQVFRTEKVGAVDIETDEETKLRAIHGTAKKTILWTNAMLLAVWAMNLGLRLHELLDAPAHFLSSTANLCLLVLILGLVAETSIALVEYTVWYLRSKKSVARGGACCPVHTRFRLARMGALLTVSILALVGFFLDALGTGREVFYLCSFGGMALLLVGCTGTIRWLKRRRAGTNAGAWGIYAAACVVLAALYTGGVTFLAFHLPPTAVGRQPVGTYTTRWSGTTWDLYRDPMPMTLEDMGIAVSEGDACSYECKTDSSVFLTLQRYKQHAYDRENGLPDLMYQIADIPWDSLREWIVARHMAKYGMEPVEDDRWGADQVCYGKLEEPWDYPDGWRDQEAYLLVKGDRVAWFFPRRELTADQFARAWSWD